MDNYNNGFENRESGNAYSTNNGAAVNNAQQFSQGQYPQPPEWTKNIVVSEKPWIPSEEDGNVSVQFNEPEKQPHIEQEEEKQQPESKKEWPMWLQIGFLVVAAIVALLLIRYALDVRKGDKAPTTLPVASVTQETPFSTTVHTTVPAVTTSQNNVTTEKEKETTTASKQEKTTAADNKKTSSDAFDKGLSEGEIKKKVVAYFNESSNRVKTEATKVVKNFEKRTHNEDKLNLPAAIKGVAKSILESKITDVTEPVEYPTAEAIIARYPVPGQEWSSKLTANDVAKATCVEKGDEYEITLVLKNCVDPEPGKGTSKAMDCLDVPTVRDTAPPFITAFSAEYYDCVIRCKVEKSTGRVIWSNYTTPVLLKLGLDAGFVKFDAEIGLTFEKDYTITY